MRRITDEFLSACSTGDLAGLEQLLHDDVVMLSDGGGRATAARVPVVGADHVGRFFLGIFKKAPPTARLAPCRVNGQPGYAMYDGDELVTIMSLDVVDGRVKRMFMIRNPDKLARAAVK